MFANNVDAWLRFGGSHEISTVNANPAPQALGPGALLAGLN